MSDDELPPTLTAFRRAVLETLDKRHAPLQATPSHAFVWPTAACSIGCAHCSFASQAGSDAALDDPDALIRWLVAAGAKSIVLCGGGEPLDEPDYCAAAIRAASRTEMDLGVYTSGSSLKHSREPSSYVAEWKRERAVKHPGRFAVRLSVDIFHTERIGVDGVCEWIRTIESAAPEWNISLRGLKLTGDRSFEQIAARVGGQLVETGTRGLGLRLPSGRRVPVQRMAYIVDGRATLGALDRRGLQLAPEDHATLEPLATLVGRRSRLGRPLSRRITLGRTRVDLEIHPDNRVHLLEAQAADLRLGYREFGWPAMRDIYYRDPLVHAIAHGGIGLVSEILADGITSRALSRSTVPFSVEQLTDLDALDWVTATIVERHGGLLGYPDPTRQLADGYLARRRA